MLTHYLETANKLLSDLIDTTKNDIADIKEAKHDSVFTRTKIKDELVRNFENHKSLIDNEIIKKATANDGVALEDLLSEYEMSLLDTMRQKLAELQKVNKHFASMVIAISELYNSLLNRIVPSEQVGYEKSRVQYASMLQIKG
jgi:hypothetical protein